MLRIFTLASCTLVLAGVAASPLTHAPDADASSGVERVDVRARQMSFPGDWPPPPKKEVKEGEIDVALHHRKLRLKKLEEEEAQVEQLLGPDMFRPEVSKHAKLPEPIGVKPISETPEPQESESDTTGIYPIPEKSKPPVGGEVKKAKKSIRKDSKSELPTAPENDGKSKLEAKKPPIGSITAPVEEDC